MFNIFPREVGFPERKLIYNDYEYYTFITKYNHKKNIYVSLYSFKSCIGIRPIYTSADIDKLFFDFDGDKSIYAVRILVSGLLKENISFAVHFSGGGFHVFVFTHKPENFNSKEFVRISQLHILDTYKIREYCDPHIISDIARIVRIVNSYNVNRNRFCIPLYSHEVFLPLNKIKKLAEKSRQIKDYINAGNKFVLPENIIQSNINLTKLEYNDPVNNKEKKLFQYPVPDIEINDIKSNHIFVEFDNDQCINDILKKVHPTHNERFLLVLHFSNKFRQGAPIENFNKELLIKMIVDELRKLKWDDWNEDPHVNKSTVYQTTNIINKNYNYVPGCTWRLQNGICTGPCNRLIHEISKSINNIKK